MRELGHQTHGSSLEKLEYHDDGGGESVFGFWRTEGRMSRLPAFYSPAYRDNLLFFQLLGNRTRPSAG